MENDFAKADMENASQNAKESLDSLTAFNDKMRATTLERIDAIRGLISANYGEAIEAWNDRACVRTGCAFRHFQGRACVARNRSTL